MVTFIGRPLVSMGSNNDANDDDNEKNMNKLIVAMELYASRVCKETYQH